MFRILAIDHIVLRTAQPARLIEFYRSVLGCAVEREQQALGLVQLRAGSSLIDIVDVHGDLGAKGGAAPGEQGRNLDHFCVRVAPFDASSVCGQLARHGVEASTPARRYGAQGFGLSVYLTDPDGNVVELRGEAAAEQEGQ